MERVGLIDTTIEDRRSAYDWLYRSDYSNLKDSPTDPPGSSPPSYEEFMDDYSDLFFNGSSPDIGRCYLIELKGTGESIGMISYTSFHLNPEISELDIWLKSGSYLGHGLGTQALQLLCSKLFEELGYHTLVIRPYKKNIRAVKSYMKAGFNKVELDPPQYYKQEFIPSLSDGDHGKGEDVFMVRRN
jgi:RimJ/RimL family protein N-acetyltransferase